MASSVASIRSIQNGPVVLQLISSNRKLSRIKSEEPESDSRWRRPIPKAPYVCSTYVSVEATCPDTCRFKNRGCYVQAGITGRLIRKLDDAAVGMSADDVIFAEAELLQKVFRNGIPQDGYGNSGRDLRLHVGGDVSSEAGAAALAIAAKSWQERGGGHVWTYTHRWRETDRRAWGLISVSASVETNTEADEAWRLGYVPVLTLPDYARWTPYSLPGSKERLRLIPCSATTTGSNCVDCRQCVDPSFLRSRFAVGMKVHGSWYKIATDALSREIDWG